MRHAYPVWIITAADESELATATCSEEAEDLAKEAGYTNPVARRLEDDDGAFWAVEVDDRSIFDDDQ